MTGFIKRLKLVAYSPALRPPWVLALGFMLLAAWFSRGAFWPDEHFQILEYLALKLGWNTEAGLPWEFHERMRPWIQPWFYYGTSKVLGIVGIQSANTLAWVFRLFSGFVGWFAFYLFYGKCSPGFLNTIDSRRAALLACFLYFYPFLWVRLSSETLSTSFFVLALALFFLNQERKPGAYLAAGVLFGICAAIRYQNGLLVLGWLAWWVVLQRPAKIPLLVLLLGTVLPLFASVAIDTWGYGEMAFTPWNYVGKILYQQSSHRQSPLWAALGITTHREEIDTMEVSLLPWYGFFVLTWKAGPIATLLHATLFLFWLRAPRNPITWATIPYYCVHCLVGHKELRYLFPVAYFLPWILPLALSFKIRSWNLWEKLCALTRRPLGKFFLLLNGFYLVALCFRPLKTEDAVQTYILKRFPSGFQGYVFGGNPYGFSVKPHLEYEFFKPKNFRLQMLKSHQELNTLLATAKEPFYLWVGGRMRTLETLGLEKCQIQYEAIPLWSMRYNLFNWVSRTSSWNLYACPAQL